MRELPYKLTSGLRRSVASLTGMVTGATLLVTLGLVGKPAQAQTPPEPPRQPATNAQVIPQDYQSQNNPFPSGWGNAQNRGWSPDSYWGILNGNIPWGIPSQNASAGDFPTLFPVPSRVPDTGLTSPFLELDGWGYPRSASLFGAFLTRASVTVEPGNYPVATPGLPGQPNPAAPITGFAGRWAAVDNGQPSSITSGANRYFRSAAQTRLNVAPQAVPPEQRFVYDMRAITYTGANNSQERFQVRVSIPSPNPTATPPENRVTDARYVVYYYVRLSDGSFLARSKTYTISQAGGGEEVLTNANGNPAFFPFFIQQAAATFGNGPAGTPQLPPQDDLGVPFQGVIVDNTTGNTGESLFVLAETLQLVPAVDQVAATPTITPPHGGRRVASANPDPRQPYTQYQAGSQPYQPMVGPNYGFDQNGTGIGAFVDDAAGERYNNSSDFINDPFDPRYNPDSTDPLRPYDAQRPYQSWNPSTLFRGPESLIDPRRLPEPPNALPAYPFPFGQPLVGDRVGPGTNNRPQVPVRNPLTGQVETTNGQPNGPPFTRVASSVDANNNDIYRRNRRIPYQPNPAAANYNPAVPYYSQTQVIIARTEYVLDPEDGVPDSEKDGTLTLQVGAVFGLDWQTGTPIWRFPDRTYAESRTTNGGYRVNTRNPFVPATPSATFTETDNFTQAARNPLNPNVPQYLVPGIRSVDKNLDGVITDDEVFIVGQAGNGNGGLFASVTMAPRVKVRGNVRLPLYRTQTDPTTGRTFTFIRHVDDGAGTTLTNFAQSNILQPGRYAGRAVPFDPVEVGVLYVAAANGVVYALDAYGNNDNDYVPYSPSPVVTGQPDYRAFGEFRPGTTNVLWTFSAINSRQGDTDRNGSINSPNESAAAYNTRLKQEIPGTGSFNQSSPVLAFQRDGGDFTQTTTGTTVLSHPFNWQGEEQRLFIGNGNGVLYAMDSAADAGRTFGGDGAPTGVQNLPFRKESYLPTIAYNPTTAPVNPNTYVFGALGLKWWFQTFSGGINATPAVSIMRQDAGTYNGAALSTMEPQGLEVDRPGRKGVFFTSLEGRVYALDWSGPVTKFARNIPLSIASGLGDTVSQAFDDPLVVGRNTFGDTPPPAAFAGGTAPATLAEALNDGWYFHNIRPTATNGLADQKEGTVRPRWTYPNLYQDIDATDNTRSQVVDNAVGNGLTNPAGETIAGARLLDGTTGIGQITTPPVLIDFPYQAGNGTTRYRSYLAFQAPDFSSDPSPTQSRLYLLDQIGDRANFLTNPRVRGTGTARRIVSHPRDRWSPGVVLAESAPAWSYRMVYDRLQSATGTSTSDIDISRRNSPLYTGNQAENFSPVTLADLSANNLPGEDRVAIPGRRVLPTLYIGGIGRVYSIDFDIETGLFMRWRPGSPTNDAPQIASVTATGAFTPLPDVPGEPDDQIFAPGAEAPENRLNPLDYTYTQVSRPGLAYSQVLVRVTPFVGPIAQVSHITITGGPNQNRSAVQPANSSNTTLTEPTVPGFPTDNVPNLGLPYVSLLQAVRSSAIADITRYDFGDLYDTTSAGASQRGITRRVNQEINDPLTTSEGYRASLVGRPNTDPANRVPNTAYQFPLLLVTDIEGYLHAISSNTEGEDYQSDTVQHTVGWAVLGFSDQVAEPISARHTLQFTQQGPGGLSGVAVLTNAYLPALDPTFSNTARATANSTDPYRFYPNGEPNTVSPTPYRVNDVANQRVSPQTAIEPVANNDDPRPAFRPRSLSPGQAAGTDTNGNATPETLADWHTGQTGFPLDLNGLFFDKRYAGRYGFTPSIAANEEQQPSVLPNGLDTRTTDPVTNEPLIEPLQINQQHPNGDYRVRLRLPGYDFIGGLLLNPATGTATGRRDTQNNLFEEMVVATNPNNQVPNGARVERNTATGEATGDLTDENDDINPAAQNVAWIYAGGQNGLAYAYTPALPGQSSGFAAGTPVNNGPYPPGENDQPLIAIVNRNFFETVILPHRANGTQLPSTFPQDVLANSVARNNGKNFYEWGESVYIVVYNLAGRTRQQVTAPGQVFVSPNRRITLDFIAENVNTTSGRAVVQQERQTGTENLITYPASNQQGASPVGIAVYEYRLTGNPSATLPQTPGANIRVSVNLDAAQRIGRYSASFAPVTDPTGLGTASDVYFTIANPLAVQGVLVDTADGRPLLAAGNKGPGLQNGIGPFAAAADDAAVPKAQVVGQINGQVAAVTEDPDAENARYAQALTNGNYIIRRNLRRFNGVGGAARPNPRFNNILTDANRTPEPTYYMPVMASAYYIGHGSSGSTDTGPGQQNLRIMNRSLLSALGSVRVDSVSSFLFRSWPGRVPNAPGDIVEPFSTPALNNNNPRFTPPGMDLFGRINPLPWEAIGADVRPWAADSPVNNNPDYPDILVNPRTIRVAGPGGDFTAGNGTLTAGISGGANQTVGAGANPVSALASVLSLNATITVPKYQAANLVATHSLTSTFVAPSSADNPSNSSNGGIVLQNNDGAVQLPRATGTAASDTPRALERFDGGGRGITPFGYTAAMRVFAGSPNTTRVNASAVVQLQNNVTGLSSQASNRTLTSFSTGAYRDFEIDFGIPVDMRLEVAGKGTDVIDLGILGHSFGVDNGLLGYGLNGLYAPGILPPPLVDLMTFRNPNTNQALPPYERFFKAFTARNEGNVNLYNVRASQRSQVVVNNNGTPTITGYRWFGLQSQNVDSRYAIGAVGADVLGAINNQLPQVVTSLDPRYDGAWDTYLQNSNPVLYQQYYRQFAGRHTLHKARTGATRGSVLSVPDVPSATRLAPVQQEIEPEDPQVGVAVPIGTPSAVYATPEVRSGDDRTARAILGQSLVLFEDHDTDTNNPYRPVPQWSGNGITPAGPLYAGQNIRPYLNEADFSLPIVGEDPLSARYSLWRVRGIVQNPNGVGTVQYQPYTERGLPLRVTVSESPLTGDVPDRARMDGTTGPIVASGRLPGIDPFPLVDRSGTLLRPAQALAPAAFRGPDGSINVYFTRNVTVSDNGTPDLGAPFAQPGSRYSLFFTRLQWNTALGTWQPQNPGAPIAAVPFASGADYTGGAKWFTTPAPLQVPGVAIQSNTSPFVLDTRNVLPSGGASLLWVNETPIGQGGTYGQIYVAPLGGDGQITSQPVPFLDNYDPTIQRFSPRAIYAPNVNQTVVFYYGGTGGRYSLYYSIRAAGTNGFPTDRVPNAAAARERNREIQLPLPASLAAASDPMPVYRFMQVPTQNGQGVRDALVVDVYYTGLSRTNQVPSIYMSRYELARRGGGFVLQPLVLPRVRYEAMTVSAREPVYSARHIDWDRDLGRRRDLPVIRIGTQEITNRNRWRIDAGTGLLYQGFVRDIGGRQTQNVVYVDAAAGVVRFRGTGIPRRSENVYVDYQPSSYRVTPDGQSNQGAFVFYDARPIAETLRSVNQPTSGNVLRRTRPMPNVGRQWIIWQKGANQERGGALVHAVRRVGVDLKAVSTLGGRMTESDSIRLSPADQRTNQTPLVQRITIYNLDDNDQRRDIVTDIPYEVDVAKGRIYVDPQYEGLFIEVSYNRASDNASMTAEAVLAPIDELAETSTQPREVLIPLRRVVNEIQPYAFLDTFDPTGGQYDSVGGTGQVAGAGNISGRVNDVPRVVATNPLNGRQEFADPSLQPGRVWLFWSSPRGRQGTATANGIDLFPGGYDLYWQTLAPEFEPYLSPLLPIDPTP